MTADEEFQALDEKIQELKTRMNAKVLEIHAVQIKLDYLEKRLEEKTITQPELEEARALQVKYENTRVLINGMNAEFEEIKKRLSVLQGDPFPLSSLHTSRSEAVTVDMAESARALEGLTSMQRAERAIRNVRGHIGAVTRRTPECWRTLDKCLAMRSHLIDQHPMWKESWPASCFLPVTAYEKWNPLQIDKPNIAYPAFVSLGAWRQTQSVYVFDAEIERELYETPVSGEIPVSVLGRMPVQAPMIALPEGAFSKVGGADAVIAQMTMVGQYASLLIMLVNGETESSCISIPLKKTLDESLAWLLNILEKGGVSEEGGVKFSAIGYDLNAAEDADGKKNGFDYSRQIFTECRDDIAGVISMLLYLCSEEPDVNKIPKTPQPVRTKKTGLRWFPPDSPTFVSVGTRLGAAIKRFREREHVAREAEERIPGHHASPRPHVRRAHWHLFWSGPRNAERVARVKWLPAIPINVKLGELDTVVHPVEKESR